MKNIAYICRFRIDHNYDAELLTPAHNYQGKYLSYGFDRCETFVSEYYPDPKSVDGSYPKLYIPPMVRSGEAVGSDSAERLNAPFGLEAGDWIWKIMFRDLNTTNVDTVIYIPQKSIQRLLASMRIFGRSKPEKVEKGKVKKSTKVFDWFNVARKAR